MQLAYIQIEDPYDEADVWLNVELIEGILTDKDGDTVLQMQSGRIHYTKETPDKVLEKIGTVAEYFS